MKLKKQMSFDFFNYFLDDSVIPWNYNRIPIRKKKLTLSILEKKKKMTLEFLKLIT